VRSILLYDKTFLTKRTRPIRYDFNLGGEAGCSLKDEEGLLYPIGHEKVKHRIGWAIIVQIQTQHILLQANSRYASDSTRTRKC